MGILGLTSFVNLKPELWEEKELQDTKLVIDGSRLCYYLYESHGFDFRCGGQYGEFYHAVGSFFTALSSKRVECFVIFDGADDPSDKKLKTLQKRAIQNIQSANALAKSADDCQFLLPLLTIDVFRQALRDGGIQFAVCDSEADAEIASLAQSWNCPVLSDDSDHFIFDVKAGYIPLSFFYWKAGQLRASIFYRSKLASHFGIPSELIPLLASLAGNDYVSPDALAAFYRALTGSQRRQRTYRFSRSEKRFQRIAKKLSELSNPYDQQKALESVLQMISSPQKKCELRQVVELSLQEYNIKESNLLVYFRTGAVWSSLRTRNDHEIKKTVLFRFRYGLFSTNLMNSLTSGKCSLRVQVENCGEISANRSSLPLRQFVYSILNDVEEGAKETRNLPAVQEWDREGMTVKQSNVKHYQESAVPGISAIPSLENKQRLKVLLLALGSEVKPEIEAFPEMTLFTASLRYLLKNAQPKLRMNHLLALLCCCVKLQGNLKEENVKTTNGKCSSQSFDLRAAHSFCQWQSVLRDAINLNCTLLEPVLTPYIHKIFNGQMAHSLAEDLNQRRTPEQLISSEKQFQLFNKLKTAVTKDLLDQIAPEESPLERNSGRKAKASHVKTASKKSDDDKRWGNRFAILSHLEEQDI